MESDWFGQGGYDVRLEWGRFGARKAVERGDILVVVDVLSFSSAVVTATAHDITIYPCGTQSEAETMALRVEGEVAVHRRDVPSKGTHSLSPLSFLNGKPGAKVAVASPNGATCSRFGRDVSCLILGAFLNAQAVAEAIEQEMLRITRPITVLACGERWKEPNEDGELRFALEDYLGAGAIISSLPTKYKRSPEAHTAEVAFMAIEANLKEVIARCGSGVELIDKGFAGDVEHSAKLNSYEVVPVLIDGERFENFFGRPSVI